jgi:hypothetical protein
MATQLVSAVPVQRDPDASFTPNYARPLAVVTTLFFNVGLSDLLE